MTNVLIEHDPGTRAGRRRSRRRRRFFTMFIAIATLAGAGVGGAILLERRGDESSSSAPVPGGSDQLTTLVVTYLHDDPMQQADSLTLFAVDRAGQRPVTLFIPVGTFGQIPGQGFESIGKALELGRSQLQRLTVENLLGILIDRVVVIDDVAVGTIIEALGGIDVDVDERLLEAQDDGTRELVFPLGARHMGGAEAATYLTFRGDEFDELKRFVRAQKVWESLFAVGVQRLKLAVVDTLEPDDAADFMGTASLFAAAPVERRNYEVLPVVPVGSGEAYRVEEPAVALLVRREFAASLPLAALDVGARPRVEILNGNGKPAAGEDAAARLIRAGMKIEVTGNASSFDFRSTRIVVYGDDEPSLALGRRVRDLLGIGEVAIGRRGQTVVDVTVVVGLDFIERKG